MLGIAALRRRARRRPLIPRQSWLPRRGRPRTAAAAVDQLVPLLRKALKLSKPYSKPTIGGGLHRVTVYRRRQKCGPMTDIWMENCGIITNELDPARIVAAAVDPPPGRRRLRAVAAERRRMRSRAAVAVNA